jgi:hypothetical protein
MFKDAIDTAAQSGNRENAEDLLRYFVERKDKECFAACLYTCYPLIRPDVAVELAWRSRYMDYVMPFLIQFLRHSSEKVLWLCRGGGGGGGCIAAPLCFCMRLACVHECVPVVDLLSALLRPPLQIKELDERTKPKGESKEEEAAARATMEASAMGFAPTGMLAITDGYAGSVYGGAPGMYNTGAPGMGFAPGMPGMGGPMPVYPSAMGGVPMGGGVDMYGHPLAGGGMY